MVSGMDGRPRNLPDTAACGAVRGGGFEVLITVNGRPKARLVAAQPKLGKSGMKSWARKLRALQRRHSARSPGGTPSVLEELREERW